jgi:hypothetical protein
MSACPHCLREYVRSDDQSRKFHALCNDVSKQREWGGQILDCEAWKRLFVAAWMRASDRKVELLPALDGHGFDALYRRTSRLGKAEMTELIEYVLAWCAENEVAIQE